VTSCLTSNTGWRCGSTITPESEPHPRGDRGQVAQGHHDLQAWLLAVVISGEGDVVTDPRRFEPGVFFDTADADLVPRAMTTFRAAHPKVTLSLAEGPTPVQLDRLRDGDIDVAVVSSYPQRALDRTRLELRHLMDDPLMVALPGDHRLARRKTVRLTELANEPWIEGYPETSQTLLDASLRAGFRPRIDFAVREWTAKQGFVAAGHGLALVPLLAAASVRSDIVLARLHPDHAPVRTIHAATWRGITASAPAAGFVRCLVLTARAMRQPRR
jgi:DNA-binding transcriptional LysR family regulator